ncbi:MAG: hypothetical protein F4X44_06590 [Gammaproteobacteria bacterium]|nr:hypothetical protein [Gammaproteobacteria bacterium]
MAFKNDVESLNFTIESGTMDMGWNSIQTFSLEQGSVDLDIVGSPAATTLYADAIRWTRVDTFPSATSN